MNAAAVAPNRCLTVGPFKRGQAAKYCGKSHISIYNGIRQRPGARRAGAGAIVGRPPRRGGRLPEDRVDHAAAAGRPCPAQQVVRRTDADQQAAVKSQYRALEKGDEPPYPIHGLQRAQAKALVTGKLRIDVLVGKDGNPVTLKTIGAPSPEIARFATVVMAQEKYKPAVCHGAPCDMVFPFSMEFIVK